MQVVREGPPYLPCGSCCGRDAPRWSSVGLVRRSNLHRGFRTLASLRTTHPIISQTTCRRNSLPHHKLPHSSHHASSPNENVGWWGIRYQKLPLWELSSHGISDQLSPFIYLESTKIDRLVCCSGRGAARSLAAFCKGMSRHLFASDFPVLSSTSQTFLQVSHSMTEPAVGPQCGDAASGLAN